MNEIQHLRRTVAGEVRIPDAMQLTETATIGDSIDAYINSLERNGDRGENKNLKTKVYNNIRELKRIKKSFLSEGTFLALRAGKQMRASISWEILLVFIPVWRRSTNLSF